MKTSFLKTFCLIGIFIPFANISFGQIANNYPHDSLIQNDPSVVFVEMFEQTSVTSMINSVGYTRSSTLSNINFDSSVPPGSRGTQSCKLTTIESDTSSSPIHPNEDTYILKKFGTGVNDSVFVRFYVKYNNTHAFHHSGIWMGGYDSLLCSWPCAPVGTVPSSNKAFKVGAEIRTANVNPQTNAKFGFFNYWSNMHVASANPPFWGNDFKSPNTNATIDMSQWHCIETMIKLNTPLTDSTGELALWVDGIKVAHYGKNFPTGSWNGVNFAEGSGMPFNGFKWSSSTNLLFNYIWIKNYAPDNTGRTSPNDLLFDHIVVAKKYIGPIYVPSLTGINSISETFSQTIFPNPSEGFVKLNKSYSKIFVYNVSGQLLGSYKNTDQFSVKEFENGVYFVRTDSKVYKLIVKH
jgi:hypothetical protein